MRRALLCILLLLLLISCEKKPPALSVERPACTEEPIPTEVTAATEWLTELPPVESTTAEALPAPEEEAILSAHAIGGNPAFLVYEKGLTFYVRTYLDISLAMSAPQRCTLTLPSGCTDGEIVNGGSGAGSGEIILTVSARRNGKPVSFDYIFYGSELEYVLQTDK